MPPRLTHLITGTVKDLSGNLVVGAGVSVTNSASESDTVTSSSKGVYIVNLGNVGDWEVGDAVSVRGYKVGVGEVSVSVIVTNSPADTVNLVLSQSDKFVAHEPSTQYIQWNKVTLSDWEGKNHGSHYPLSIQTTDNRVDLVFNPSFVWGITRGDGQPDSITVTLVDGRVFKKTYTYTDVGGMSRRTAESKWVKQ